MRGLGPLHRYMGCEVSRLHLLHPSEASANAVVLANKIFSKIRFRSIEKGVEKESLKAFSTVLVREAPLSIAKTSRLTSGRSLTDSIYRCLYLLTYLHL